MWVWSHLITFLAKNQKQIVNKNIANLFESLNQTTNFINEGILAIDISRNAISGNLSPAQRWQDSYGQKEERILFITEKKPNYLFTIIFSHDILLLSLGQTIPYHEKIGKYNIYITNNINSIKKIKIFKTAWEYQREERGACIFYVNVYESITNECKSRNRSYKYYFRRKNRNHAVNVSFTIEKETSNGLVPDFTVHFLAFSTTGVILSIILSTFIKVKLSEKSD